MNHKFITRSLLYRGSSALVRTDKGRSAALGSFDGIHKGHRALLRRVVDDALLKGTEPVLVSFYPHPLIVLKREKSRPPLLTLRQKLEILEQVGISSLIMIRFNSELSQYSAERFVEEVLVRKLNISKLFIGPDATIGRDRMADADELSRLLSLHGRGLEVVKHELVDGQKIGSRLVRDMVRAGDLRGADALLGESYTLDSRVVSGEGRGKKINIPTANLSCKQLLPAYGVYVGKLMLAKKAYDAVVNIGNRPTFDGSTVSVEAHLLDYQGGDFYGDRVRLALIEKIRDEIKFENVQLLIEQIKNDINKARELLRAKR